MILQRPPYIQSPEHTSSYYAASANKQPLRLALAGDHQFDVCVVGAGYSGLSTALHLAEKGYQVAVVEGAQIGWGASGRNGGQIVNGLNASLQTIEHRYGHDTASFVASLVTEGGDIIRERISTYAIDCDLKPTNVFTAYTTAHMAELEERLALWRGYGIGTQEMLDAQQIRSYVGSEVYAGGMIDHSGGHLHPLNLALGEAAAFESRGGTVFENSIVTSVDYNTTKPVIKTSKGSITCKALVLCGNAYLGNVVPTLASRVMPVSTQIMATEPLSTVYSGTDPKDIEAKLRRNMNRVFPSLQNKRIDFAWSGNFALSFSRVPQLGRLNDNTYFAHGYSGHGVTGSHTFGRILSEAIDGDLTRFDVFAKVPWIPFPGGRMFRVPYSIAGSWYYALKDKLGR